MSHLLSKRTMKNISLNTLFQKKIIWIESLENVTQPYC